MAALPVHVTVTVLAGIDIDNKKVTPPEIPIIKSQQVEWHCTDRNRTATVRFPTMQNPFYDNNFTVPLGGAVLSGPVKDTVNFNTPYPYDIVVNGTVLQLATQAIIIIRP
jgi:hypothetical protein